MTKMQDTAREAERLARELYANADGVTLTRILAALGPPLVRIAQFSDSISILMITIDDRDACSLAVQFGTFARSAA
jgi:hypothetical protein